MRRIRLTCVLVTGARGFIGKNLVVRLREQNGVEVLESHRGDSPALLKELVAKCDSIIHLAGENRPNNVRDFERINTDFTRILCDFILATGRAIPIIFASSTQAELDNPYGKSKLEAEKIIKILATTSNVPCVVYRLPGVFGKWSKPNYNSVVATFCFNIARDLDIKVDDPLTRLNLVYIDTLVEDIIKTLSNIKAGFSLKTLSNNYSITLGELVDQILAFRESRTNLITERVGEGLCRALYSTYISFLPPNKFAYDLSQHSDDRGAFVEIVKTPDCGQFSFFSLHPGITRGSHYHHSKTEKFLVVKGLARLRYRSLATKEKYEILVSGETPQVVDTIPGWVHDITNLGDGELIVMLWANEVFNHDYPDTVAEEV